ncbi:MAG TPA: TonB-dependent receptor [Bacteroidia bacterium]|nr:TonB-dependent receptor [Bacteroidia bacterium]HRS57784.1 TonB-dependent receptor [Bacteroidia bacterium]HRU67275.1 TonB-dependent receptor [Bacteroidia bacterium]
MKKIKLLLTGMLTLMIPLWLIAQNISVTGKVTDIETGKTLSAANVVVKPSGKGCATDENGRYLIENLQPGEYTIEVSFVGFKKSTRKVNLTENKRYVFDFAMVATNFELGEVILKDWSARQDPFVKTEMKKIEIEILPTRDIGDFLRQIPNVSAIRKGGTQLDPVIRGYKYDQLNVRVDGYMRIEGGCPNRMDPNISHIEVDDIERIEVIKGPYVLRYGPTMGGFLNLVTSKPTPFEGKKFQLTARGIKGYESNWNGTKDRLNVKFGNDRVYFNLSGNNQEYGNYKDGNGNLVLSSFRKYSFTGEIGIVPLKNHEFIYSFVSSHGRDVHFPALPMDERLDDTRLMSAVYSIASPFKNISNLRIMAFNSNVHHVMDTKEKPSGDTMIGVSTIDAIVSGANLNFTLLPNENNKLYFITGIEHTTKKGDRVKTMYMQPAEPVVPVKTEFLIDGFITNTYFATEYERKFETMTLTASLRYDNNQAHSGPVYVYGLKAGKPIIQDTLYPEDITLNNLSASFGFNKYLNENLTLGLAIGRGVRSPNLLERYVTLLPIGYDKYDYLGNPDLKAEANHQADLTIKYETDKIGRVTVNGFFSYVINYIAARQLPPTQYLPNTKGVYGVKQFYNADPVYFRGFEFTYSSPEQYKLGGSLIAAYTRATMTKAWDKMTEISPDALYEIPPLDVRANVYYSFFNSKLIPRLTVRYAAPQNYVSVAYGEKTTPSFWLANLTLAYIYNHFVTLSCGINNIFNTPYYEHLNRRVIGSPDNLYEPGRVFFANLIVKI